MEKKFYLYAKLECTPGEYIERKKQSIKFAEQEIDKELKRHTKKMAKLDAHIWDCKAEINKAEAHIIPELPKPPKNLK